MRAFFAKQKQIASKSREESRRIRLRRIEMDRILDRVMFYGISFGLIACFFLVIYVLIRCVF